MNSEESIKGLIGGVGTVVITILMAQGEWDFFDLVISLIILFLSMSFLRENDIDKPVLISLFIGLVLTTLTLSAVSIGARYTSNCFLSTVSVETYKKSCVSQEDKYTLFSVSNYTLRKFKAEHMAAPKSVVEDIDAIKGQYFQKLDFDTQIHRILRNIDLEERRNYLSTIESSSMQKSLHARNELRWQLGVYVFVFLITLMGLSIMDCIKKREPEVKSC